MPVFVFIFLPALLVVAGVATIVCGIIGFIALKYGSFSEGRCIFGTVSTMHTVYIAIYYKHVYEQECLHVLLMCMMHMSCGFAFQSVSNFYFSTHLPSSLYC